MIHNFIKPIARFAFRLFFGMAARLHWHWPFVKLLTSVIEEHETKGVVVSPGARTLLALSPDSFRGDLDVLAASEKLRILQMPRHWQTRLIYLFYPQVKQLDIDMEPSPGTKAADDKQRLQSFYEGVLPKVYARLKIDCVISSHMRWVADLDWGITSKKIGVPYVILYREGLFAASEYWQKSMVKKFKRWGWFHASHLVVHNKIGRRFCLDIGYGDPEHVSSLGCLRMDDYMEKIQAHKMVEKASSKKIVFFPPPFVKYYRAGMPLFSAFKGMHVGLAKLASRRPDVEVVFKVKDKEYDIWRELLNDAFEDEILSVDDIPNLIITASLDAQDLIFSAGVVCGYNSTTVLEAAVAGKPVVVPYFLAMRRPEYQERTLFSDALQHLDVADDPEHFIQLIERRLEDQELSTSDMAEREKLFANYVSDPKGGALKRYTDLFERLIKESRAGAS
jgi:glycosyltransferase involved in cell wall biosynthesis